MKTPTWFREQIAAEGVRVNAGESSIDESSVHIAEQVAAKDSTLTKGIVIEFARKKLENWLASHRPSARRVENNGQLDLFPDLPRKLEISPGRFADQAVMTRHDWDAALKQAQTKAGNAAKYASAIEQAHDEIVPLLKNDTLTTADVWPRQKPMGLFAVGGEV
ncbi:MAG TPA: hypothetical protein VIR33_12255 [Thermopolyspora sp.]|jgi:hypothetical protein